MELGFVHGDLSLSECRSNRTSKLSNREGLGLSLESQKLWYVISPDIK